MNRNSSGDKWRVPLRAGAAGRVAPVSAAVGDLDEIPKVTAEVLEHGDRAVGRRLRLAHEPDASGAIGFVVAVKVRLQEQENAPARLIADEGLLLRRGG